MTEEDKEIIVATSNEGETSVMVCKKEEEAQKVCMPMEKAGETKAQSEASKSSKQAVGEKGMLDNNIYNLMEQLTIENKSLWRIKNHYKTDAAMDNEMKECWNFLEKEKQEIVKLLVERLRNRL